jgi:transposase-like protein
VGSEVSDGRRGVAPRLDARHSVLRVPPEVRRLIYTTNLLESVHAQLRKIIKTRGNFPHDDAATRLIWLALRNFTAK